MLVLCAVLSTHMATLIKINSLVHGGDAEMSNSKLKLLVASVVLMGGLMTIGLVSQQTIAKAASTKPVEEVKKDEPKQIERRDGKIKSLDAAKNELVVTLNEEKFDLPVFLDAKVQVFFGKRLHKLADFKPDMNISLFYEGETKNPFKIEGNWPTLDSTVMGVDATKKTVSIRTEVNKGFEFEVPLSTAEDVEVKIDSLPSGLADLTLGMKIWIHFGLNKKTVELIEAEAPRDQLSAKFKSIDGNIATLTLRVLGHQDERKIDLKFPLSDRTVFRLSGNDATSKDLLAKMPIRVKFSENRLTVTHIWAGPVGQEKEDE